MDEVQVSIEGDVAFVKLHRAASKNALTGQMFDGLRRAGLRLSDSPPAFVVLSGTGADFCVGLDLSSEDTLRQAMAPVAKQRDAHRAQELVTRLRGALESFTRLPCPVVAAVEGACHGAGLDVALVADLRVASATATFRLGDARVLSGLGGLVRAVSLIGLGRATELALCGATIDAAEALRIGLVNRVVPPGSSLSEATALVGELRAQRPAVRTQTLLALRGIQHKRIQELFDAEGEAAARTWIAADWQDAAPDTAKGTQPE